MVNCKIQRIIWDFTYACPLRCIHCYSESGRRNPKTLPKAEMLRVLDVVVSAKPNRVSISGGEPLLANWWPDALQALRNADIPITVFTSGWFMNETIAIKLAELATSVAVSIDGGTAGTHDRIRGRSGSFDRTMRALAILEDIKSRRTAAGLACYKFGADFTVTRSALSEMGDFVELVTSKFPEIDFVRFGAVVPEGLAQEKSFAESELLSDEQVDQISSRAAQLKARSKSLAEVSVTDAKYFLPNSPLSSQSEGIAHIEPDGQLRAFTNYEAKVGNVRDTPLDELWAKAIAWREDSFVKDLRESVSSIDRWAEVTRVLDRRYGSADDRKRIQARSTRLTSSLGRI